MLIHELASTIAGFIQQTKPHESGERQRCDDRRARVAPGCPKNLNRRASVFSGIPTRRDAPRFMGVPVCRRG